MSLKKEIHINVPVNNAFSHFIQSFHLWWPREYTWSRELLEKIEIGSKKDDLCSEYGPHGFRCDWGRMIEVVHNERISFTWQISPKREPVPDPSRSSVITVKFHSENEGTKLVLLHDRFENHGEGHETYKSAMDSEYGWQYILEKFREFLVSR